MSGSQRISGEAFAIERLRQDPALDYGTLRREANAAGVSMQPIQYGRARKALGLPPMQKPSLAIKLDPPAAPRGNEVVPAETDDADDTVAAVDAPEPVTDRNAGDAEDEGSDLVAPRRKGSPAFDFLVQELRREPTLAYGTLRDRCDAKGFKIAPIMYGRAKAVLGLVPVKPRGSAKKAAAQAPAPVALRQVESVAADRFQKQLAEVRQVEQLVAVVKDLDAERRRLRELLERIVTMIDEALG